MVLVLATLLAAGAAAAQAPGRVRLYGEPGSVTINGLAAPEGTRIQVKTSDGAGWGLSIAADGSWWIVLPTDPTPVTFTVDRLPVAGGPVDRSEGGQRQLALTASSLGVPLPSVLDFHGAAGSTMIGGQPAPDGAEIAAWVKGRMVSVTSAYRGAWVMSIAAGTTGIRFTVDGLPDAGGPYSSSLDGVPYWITLAAPARGTELGTTRFGGSFGSVLMGRLKVPARPGALITATSDGRVVGRTTIRADGGWSIAVPVGTFDVHFEVNRSLDRSGPYAATHPGVESSVQLLSHAEAPRLVRDGGFGVAPRDPLQHEVENTHRFSGSGFPVGVIRVLDSGAVHPDAMVVLYGGAEITSGSWSFAFSPDDFPVLVLELDSGGVFYRTAQLTLEAGGATALTSADFTPLWLPHTFRGVGLRSDYVDALNVSTGGNWRQPTIGGAWTHNLRVEVDRPAAFRFSAQIDGDQRWTREYPLTPARRREFRWASSASPPTPSRLKSKAGRWWGWAMCRRRLRFGSEPERCPTAGSSSACGSRAMLNR